MRECPNCKTMLENDELFCHECGVKQKIEEFISKPFERCAEDDNIIVLEREQAEPTEEQQFVLNGYNKSDKLLSILPKIRNYGCLCIILIGLICTWKLQNIFYAVNAFLVIMFVVQYIFKKKDGIDNIKEKKDNDEGIDRILDKIKRSGYGSLTAEEKLRLFDNNKK